MIGIDQLLRLAAAAVELYNKWFGFHVTPTEVETYTKNQDQKAVDEFKSMLAKAKAGDVAAQNWIRARLASPPPKPG